MTDTTAEAAMANIAKAVAINDLDTLASLTPDSFVVWTAQASWGEGQDVTLGDLRRIAALVAAPTNPITNEGTNA